MNYPAPKAKKVAPEVWSILDRNVDLGHHDIKPCPFCGEPAHLEFDQSSKRSNGSVTFLIQCRNPAEEPKEICLNPRTSAHWKNSDAAKAQAIILLNIAIWNRRV